MKNNYKIIGDTAIIYVKHYISGEFLECVIDISNFEIVSNYPFTWSANKWKYVVAVKKKSIIFLHKLIIPIEGMVDHVDRNPLNNQRSNLRAVTAKENAQNRSMRSDNTSGFRGVVWNKQFSKWMAYCGVDRKKICLGFYDDILEADKAAELGRLKYMPYLREIKTLEATN